MLKFKIINTGNYDAVIIDEMHANLFDILKGTKKKFLVIPIRKTIPIFLKISFFLKIAKFLVKNKFNICKLRSFYLSIILNFVTVKKVFTFFENTNRISFLKKQHPKINFYTFVNGTRVPNYKYKHDNLLTWGDSLSKLDRKKKYISNKYFSIGSLRLLNYFIKKKKSEISKIDIIYISAYSKNKKKSALNFFSNIIMVYEKILLNNISIFLKKNKCNFKILMKSTISENDFQSEINYFLKYFPKKNILIKKNYLKAYEYIDQSKITISLVSALGLEALSLNTKVLLGFSIKQLKSKLKFYKSFSAYSKYLCKETSLINLSPVELESKILNLSAMSRLDYQKKTSIMRQEYSQKPILNNFKKIIYEI